MAAQKLGTLAPTTVSAPSSPLRDAGFSKPQAEPTVTMVQLLILDDWGTHGLADRQRLDLLEICEERYRRRSTLITAQLPVAKWHDLIGEATVADAILDRIVHNAHRITLKGESMRRKNARPDLTPADAPEDNQA